MNTETPHHILQCRLATQSGSIERMLRVIRVRGFTVRDLRLEYIDAAYQASIVVSGSRSVENLIRQLSKLVEVSSVFASAATLRTLEQCA